MTSDKFGGWHGWRKSSYSDANGNCLEVGAWRKSTYSSGDSNCVEVGADDRIIGVRDTQQHGSGPVLEFPAEAWRGFLAVIRAARV